MGFLLLCSVQNRLTGVIGSGMDAPWSPFSFQSTSGIFRINLDVEYLRRNKTVFAFMGVDVV